jgi:hypothetical protein
MEERMNLVEFRQRHARWWVIGRLKTYTRMRDGAVPVRRLEDWDGLPPVDDDALVTVLSVAPGWVRATAVWGGGDAADGSAAVLVLMLAEGLGEHAATDLLRFRVVPRDGAGEHLPGDCGGPQIGADLELIPNAASSGMPPELIQWEKGRRLGFLRNAVMASSFHW